MHIIISPFACAKIIKMNEESSFTGLKVDEILADFFVKKLDEMKETKKKNSSLTGNHLDNNTKEKYQKGKHKKKKHKKHKKSKHKHLHKERTSDEHVSKKSDRKRKKEKQHKHSATRDILKEHSVKKLKSDNSEEKWEEKENCVISRNSSKEKQNEFISMCSDNMAFVSGKECCKQDLHSSIYSVDIQNKLSNNISITSLAINDSDRVENPNDLCDMSIKSPEQDICSNSVNKLPKMVEQDVSPLATVLNADKNTDEKKSKGTEIKLKANDKNIDTCNPGVCKIVIQEKVENITLSHSKNICYSDSKTESVTLKHKAKIVIKDLKSSNIMETLKNVESDNSIININPSSLKDVVKIEKGSLHSGSSASDSESGDKNSCIENMRKNKHSSDTEISEENSSREKEKKKHKSRHKRKRTKEKNNSYSKERNHSRKKHRKHSRDRSASPKKSGEIYDLREKIDKAKLLEAARRNVLSMIERGTFPKGVNVENLKQDQLLSIKAGGKSVQELTEFCRAISKREADVESGNSELNITVEEDNPDHPFIHHPFKLREQQPVIKVNIKNAVQLPVKSHAEKVAENARLSLQFPVSSGSQHRQKELEWIPVEKNHKSSNSTSAPANEYKSKSTKLVPSHIQEKEKESAKDYEEPSNTIVPSLKLLPPSPPPLPPPPPELILPFLPPHPPPTPPPLPPLPPPPPPLSHPHSSRANFSVSLPPTVASFLVPSVADEVLPLPSVAYDFHTNFTAPQPLQAFPLMPSESLDISSIVSDRLKAVRKLQEKPNDPGALEQLHQAQLKLQAWVQSKQLPGQFTGSTDVKVLSVQELSGPNPVWVKKDIFSRAAPVTEGKGMSLLKKMGWNPGEGLGKNKEGTLEPLMLDIKTDKRGLVSESEMGKKNGVISAVKDLSGKHPVSALMELCSKRKWPSPVYTIVNETGPSHKKMFLFKVKVNSVEYQPSTSSQNKKIAKAQSALVCLQSLGLVPKSQAPP